MPAVVHIDKKAPQLTAILEGAIGDGEYHPLSENFATLAEAQAEYPAALSLEDSTDWAAIQSSINQLYDAWVAGVTGNNGAFPAIVFNASPPLELLLGDGVFAVNRRIDVKGLTIRGTSTPHYVLSLNGFASSTNTVNGTIIKAIEGASGFSGSEVFNCNPDNSNLQGLTIDGAALNHGTLHTTNFFAIDAGGAKFTPDSSGRGWAGAPLYVIDPNDPDQYRGEILTTDLPPIFTSLGDYEERIHAWVGKYTTSIDLRSFAVTAGALPPGLTLDTDGRLHGTFAPASALDIKDYDFTVTFSYRVDGALEDSTATASYRIGVVTPYIGSKTLPILTEGLGYTFNLAIANTDGSDYAITYTSELPNLTINSLGEVVLSPVAGQVGVFDVDVTVEYLLGGNPTGITDTYQMTQELVAQGSGMGYSNDTEIKRGWVQGQYREVQILVHGQTGSLTYSIDLNQTLSGFENQNPGYPQEVSPGIWSPGPGITFDATTGLMQGTPTNNNRYTFYLKVTDGTGKFRTEPMIVNVAKDTSSAPFFNTRSLPVAVVGEPYSFQMDITNLAGHTVHCVPLPTGLTLDENTGLISGTPVGLSLVAGVLWRYSALASDITIKNFLVGIGSSGNRLIANGNSKPSNLHRLERFMLRACRYGLYLEKCFDSHISNGYIAGCWVGINLQSGAAAMRFIDLRIEFIGKYGIQANYANENQFQSCFFDTCGSSAIKAENSVAIQIQNCIFFRSGRLVPGTSIPPLPQANRERSNHLRMASCKKPLVSGNTFLVGRMAEGASNNYISGFPGYNDYARPATVLSTYNNYGLLFADNVATGCCHASYSNSKNDNPKFSGNKFNYLEFEESYRTGPKIGNLIENSDFSLNSRQSSYTIPGPMAAAGSLRVMEFWEVRHGTLTQDINVTQEVISDSSLPFTRAIRITKLAETNATVGQTQNFNLSTSNQLGDRFPLVRGKKMVLSFYLRGPASVETPTVLTQFVLNPADNAYPAADFFGPRLSIKPYWQRHEVLVDMPAFDKAEIGKDYNPFITTRLVMDEAWTNYDVMYSGYKLEEAPDGFVATPYQIPDARALRELAMSKDYIKSILTAKYFGEAGANWTPAGTVQMVANGVQNPRVNVVFPVPLDRDDRADNITIISYRDANNRLSANFNSVSQLDGSTAYTFNISQKNRYGFTLEVTGPLPPAGTVLLFHYEVNF